MPPEVKSHSTHCLPPRQPRTPRPSSGLEHISGILARVLLRLRLHRSGARREKERAR